jgi:alkylmercury lyase
MRIELLTSPGCPHATAARETVTDCLTTLGIHVPIAERVGRYPSPTVLVDGIDVMRPEAGASIGDACRLDLPTTQRVLQALRDRCCLTLPADPALDTGTTTPTEDGDSDMSADRFAATVADTLLGPDQQPGRNLMRTAVRLLAHGKPVTVAELATAAGVDVADVSNAPAGRDVEYDDDHRIVGWGLTLIPTPHTYIVDGHHLYTWCAADTLLFPAILGSCAHIESRCPTTDTVIRLTVDPQAGVSDLSPATAVISIPGSQEMDITRVRATTCNPGRYFATAQAAEDWLAQYPGGAVLPVADAYPQLRPISNRLLDLRQTPSC